MISIKLLWYASIFILIFILLILKVEFASPGFIFVSSFALCSSCAVYMAQAWGISYIHIETFEIIVISMLIFILVEEGIRFLVKLYGTKKIFIKTEKTPITISQSILYVTIFIGAISIVWCLIYVMKYASAGNINAIMARYKNVVNKNVEIFGIGRKFLNQIYKVLIALNYILLYVYNYNSSCNCIPTKTKVLYWITFGEYILFSMMLVGGRQTALFFLTAWLTNYVICNTYKQRKKNTKRANRKYIKLLVGVIICIFPLFYFTGRMVGRKESEVLYAATSYLTTGIYGLEWEIRNKYASQYWGEISFPGLYPLLKFLGILPNELKEQSFLPFFWHGNTVSLLGRWYWDFGKIGVYVMVFFVSVFFSYIYYYRIKYSENSNKRNIFVIIYTYSVHILYFAGYDDFFMNIISLNFFIRMVLICVLYELIVKRRMKLIFGKGLVRRIK